MKGRSISNNISLNLDLLDDSDLVNEESSYLFLDFCKAFDTVEHNFMYQALNYFGFGPTFTNMMHTLYKNIVFLYLLVLVSEEELDRDVLYFPIFIFISSRNLESLLCIALKSKVR